MLCFSKKSLVSIRFVCFVLLLMPYAVLAVACDDVLSLEIPEKTLEFYVSPDGNDVNPGTKESPFGTILKAQQVVREIVASGLNSDAAIFLRGGIYNLEKSLILLPEDSGTDDYSIKYSAHPGEKPVITGGSVITGWQRKGQSNLWQAHIPEVESGKWRFRDLFRDGNRLTRSRFPNEDEKPFTVKTVSEDFRDLSFNDLMLEGISSPKEMELVIILNWTISRGLVASLGGDRVQTVTNMGRHDSKWTSPSPGKFAFLEHGIEFVDKPGEWHLDSHTGVLSYMAEDNENPNEHLFMAPKLDQILIIQGKKNNPVRNIHFEGIDFRFANWQLPAIGNCAKQAGHYGGARSIKEPDLPVYSEPVAIELTYARNCTFKLCRILNTGSSGFGFGVGCRYNRVTGCELFDIGCNGINIGHRTNPVNRIDEDWKCPEDVPVGNQLTNNYIHNCGAVNWGGVAISAIFSQDTVIAHNLISDVPYTGITVGFKWTSQPTSQKSCLVEYNHIFNVMTKLADGAGIYSLGFQPGTVIRGNMVHHVVYSPFAGFDKNANGGIYFDAGSVGLLVTENIVFDMVSTSLRFNENTKIGGIKNMRKGITWHNNYFDTEITDPEFPWHLAAKAGLEPAYRRILLCKKRENMTVEK